MLARAHLQGSLEGAGPAYSLATQILQIVEGEGWAVSLPQVAIGARIMVAREAITQFRKGLHLEEAAMEALNRKGPWPYSYKVDLRPQTYGFIGLLDYISTGDPAKILDPALRSAVKRTLKAWPQIVKEALK